jgi:hypothetical protein
MIRNDWYKVVGNDICDILEAAWFSKQAGAPWGQKKVAAQHDILVSDMAIKLNMSKFDAQEYLYQVLDEMDATLATLHRNPVGGFRPYEVTGFEALGDHPPLRAKGH